MIAVLSIISCSAKNYNPFYYTKNPTPIVKNQAKYYVSEVNVKFNYEKSLTNMILSDSAENRKKTFANYPDEKQLAQMIKNMLEDRMREQGIYAENSQDKQSFALKVDLDYTRVMTFLNIGYATFKASYDLSIFKNKEQLAEMKRVDQVITSPSHDNAVGSRLMFMYGDKTEEEQDLVKLTDIFVRNLKNLGEEK